MRPITCRSILYIIAFVLFVAALVFWGLFLFGWFALEPGPEPLSGLAEAAVFSLGGFLALLWARRAKDTPIGAYDPTPAQRARNRQAMIQRVRDFWIKGVLEQSLYHEARIELGLKEQPEAIATLQRDFEDTLTFYRVQEAAAHDGESWPAQHLRTTSHLEREFRAWRRRLRLAVLFHSPRGLTAVIHQILTRRTCTREGAPPGTWQLSLERALAESGPFS